MRLPVLVCCLASLPASNVLAAPSPSPFSAGVKVGVGGVGVPGLGTLPVEMDFGAVVQRAVGRRDYVIVGVAYQGTSLVHAEYPGMYTFSLASAFGGYKSRLTRGASGPYLGATVGLTRWSGRPGDSGVSPTLGAFVGAEAAVLSRSRIFVEAGTRYGLQPTAASIPHWNLGVGFAKGF